MYSQPCRIVKYPPSRIVISRANLACLNLFCKILWWAQVIEMPEDNRIVVFNKGICKGLKGVIPWGGHSIPISMLGDKLLCKKAQKKETKKNTSDTINKIIPHCKPIITLVEWLPCRVASRIISRHHW